MTRISPALREARTCYDHLAGRLGVALAEALAARGDILLSAETAELTEQGRTTLTAFGIPPDPIHPTKRPFCRPCQDWTERRPHLAGALGAALCARCAELGWIRRTPNTRALEITPKGRRGFAETFGLPETPPKLLI